MVDLVLRLPNLSEEQNRSEDDEENHDHYQVEHLKVDEERGPLTHESVSLHNVGMTVLSFVVRYELLALDVELDVLLFSH